ncbi:MAG TPA: GNAT family N-acetyltransferase [Rugosimonospora sp.]|nr:GNAT family N-acetyltransferase [Rugosimonospora sp.]
MDGYTLRTATADDWAETDQILQDVFNETWENDAMEPERLVFEPDRTTYAVAADGEIAGQVGAYTRDMTVPGGTLPCGHVTMVGVRATHRRRGLLRWMITEQLADIRGRGEPIAALWASEGRIYQRFGYGLAAWRLALEIDHEVALNTPVPAEAGRLRSAKFDDTAADLLTKTYERVRLARPGFSNRSEAWWRKVLSDPPSAREGATPMRLTVHEGTDGIDGYAIWRVKTDWDHSPKGQVQVRELITADPVAYRALVGLLLSVDLTRTVTWGRAAVDEPVLQMVNEPRRLGAAQRDALWVRVTDLPAALAGRRYATPVDVVLGVTDALLPENAGTWRLTGDTGSATCARTGADPDLSLDVQALGAAYLGGPTLAQLAAAGRVVEHTPGALARASAAFGWLRQPAATEGF